MWRPLFMIATVILQLLTQSNTTCMCSAPHASQPRPQALDRLPTESLGARQVPSKHRRESGGSKSGEFYVEESRKPPFMVGKVFIVCVARQNQMWWVELWLPQALSILMHTLGGHHYRSARPCVIGSLQSQYSIKVFPEACQVTAYLFSILSKNARVCDFRTWRNVFLLFVNPIALAGLVKHHEKIDSAHHTLHDPVQIIESCTPAILSQHNTP